MILTFVVDATEDVLGHAFASCGTNRVWGGGSGV